MAEVIPPDRRADSAASLNATCSPALNLASNSDFSVPMQPRSTILDSESDSNESVYRPAAMRLELSPLNTTNFHRRTASTLPNFSFNNTDNSGRKDDDNGDDERPQTPDENTATTPSRRGHKRGGSEFVGGDSRFGVSNAVSSSPTKTTFLSESGASSNGLPKGRRGHAHRRSAAISSHDVGKLMQPSSEIQPRLSSSLPNTPLEHPAAVPATDTSIVSIARDKEISDPFGPPLPSSNNTTTTTTTTNNMRSAIIAAPFVAAAYAATSKQSYTLVPEISGTVTVTSTYYYSNPATKYLTETNSVGVVTGMPTNTLPTNLVTTQPAPVLTQPEVATIPAGVIGTTVILLNATNGLTSFTVVGYKSSTTVLGEGATFSTTAGSQTAGGSGPHHTGGSGSGSGAGASGSGTASASASSSSGAASNVHLASGGLVGLAAFIAALL